MEILDLITTQKKYKFLEQHYREVYKKIYLYPELNSIFHKIQKLANSPAVFLQDKENIAIQIASNLEKIKKLVAQLSPWKKGPYIINEFKILSEWNSLLKWKRINRYLTIKDKVVLDLGCNNGYFMFQAIKKKPHFILGLDPIALFFLQGLLFSSLIPTSNLHFSLLGYKDLDYFEDVFDEVLCLGVLYHHKEPLGILNKIYKTMKKGGRVIVDVQGLPTARDVCLFPSGKYFGKKNFYFLPSPEVLKSWMKVQKFKEVEIIYAGDLFQEEQNCEHLRNINSVKKTIGDNANGYPYPYRIYAIGEK